MKNAEVAHLLREIADLLEMQEVAFKPQAYRRAARQIEALSEPIEEIHERGELEGIEHVGQGIAERIAEYLATGSLAYHEELKEEMPVDIQALTAVEGLGPKRVEKLYHALGITSLDELEAAAQEGKIADVEGFGEKLQARILDHIGLARSGQERTLLGKAFPLVEDLINQLRVSNVFGQLTPVGSFRRRLPTVGDVDILATAEHPERAMDAFASLDDIQEVLSRGQTKSSLVLTSGLQVDLRVVDEGVYGAALVYFTGSKDHNIQLRRRAQDRDLKLNEYGLFDGDEAVAAATEAEVYQALDLTFIEPELREATGEIRAAASGKLPDLVTAEDIRGDLQMHTTWSDGSTSIREMACKAEELGYAYIAITDHGPALTVAGGPTPEDYAEIRAECEEASEETGVQVLLGIEANIGKEGRLDVPDEALDELDLVVIALHERTEEATERILTAMREHRADVLAHPTNRRIGQREPNELDLGAILEAAVRHNVAIEINGQPDRLDLDWRLVKEHRGKVPFVVSTDAHTPGQMDNMQLGVAQARKGWLEKGNVLNTRSWADVKRFL